MATDAMQNGKLYWWDELEILILQTPQLPRNLDLEINGGPFEFTFFTDDTLTQYLIRDINSWNASKAPTNERLSLFLQLWQTLQPLTYAQQMQVLGKIRQWAGVNEIESAHTQVMCVQELNDLSANSLFSIGAHTVHHAMLGQQEVEDQAFEVQESKKVIEGWLGKKVTGFAYPYGNYNSTTKLLLRDAGFRYAVSTESRGLTDRDDLFEMPRMQVKNWDAHELSTKINELMNHD
jgi:hypothetical protein